MDKLEKVKAEIERRYNEYMAKDSELAAIRADECLGILSYIDSMQEECNITGVKSRHVTGKLKECIDNQTEEGLDKARKQLEENPQECMYARDNYTDEDRKVLCEGCEEECEYNKKEDVWWLQELHNKLDSLSKEDFEKVWAKYHQKEESVSERFAFKAIPRLLEMIESTDRAKAYTAKLADAFEVEGYSTDAKIVRESIKVMNGEKVPMATMDDEPVSKELTDEIKLWLKQWSENEMEWSREDIWDTAEHFANWQKQQMMTKAFSAEIGKQRPDYKCVLNGNFFKYDTGDKVKLIIIEEE